MTDELITSICHLLTRDDSDWGSEMPSLNKIDDLEAVLVFLADQDTERDMRDAINEVRTAIQVIQVSHEKI